MKSPALLLFLLCAWSYPAQSASTNFHLRIERSTNGFDLIVNGAAQTGAFLVYQAHDPQSLSNSVVIAMHTNTALATGMRFTVPMTGPPPSQAFFAAAHWPGMVFVPSGSFPMGDVSGDSTVSWPFPVHSVEISSFCMGETEVTKALWDEVRTWAVTNGYDIAEAPGKAADHPAHSMRR
jgi:formylglycine-generating enzyme required for sulfatase activity